MKLILASASPRRKQLLADAGYTFEVMVAATDEHYPEDLPIAAVPEYIAREKALAVAQRIDTDPATTLIIAADTVVVLNGTIIGKPEDRTHARDILSRLSGQTHEVITGVHLIGGDRQQSFSSTTEVQFNPLSMQQIDYYIDHYQPFDKAGSYAIQEWIGLIGIAGIRGDMYNVIGLPVNKLVQELNAWGISCL